MPDLKCVFSNISSEFIEGEIYLASSDLKTVIGEDGDTSEPWELSNLCVVAGNCAMIARFEKCE